MQTWIPDAVRLQPSSCSLNVILKNTYFPDDLLKEGKSTRLSIDYRYPIAVGVFKFGDPYYDFVLPFRVCYPNVSETGWLNQTDVLVKLVLADPVIADNLSSLTFRLASVESDRLRENIKKQSGLTVSNLREIEERIYAEVNSFLL